MPSSPGIPGRPAALVGTILLLGAAWGCADRSAPETVGPRPDYAGVAAKLSERIEFERASKGLPAVSIALVDDQETVWAAGFGEARPGEGRPATAATIYRVGSVSKLFTDLAVMQLVERGELDLDAPITAYLPELSFEAPAGAAESVAPTLRHLMSHRAGIVREPPVGHYFADDEPTLAETVASLRGSRQVYPTGSRVKYSNAGIAIVGYTLERTRATPFAEYVKGAVLEPLGMDRSAFAPEPAVREGLAEAVMRGYDGREFPAPTFELGMSPAGSMYAPVTDLATFMSAVFAGGVGERGRVLSEASLTEMLTPQFGEDGGFGLGFAVGTFDGRRWAGHGGAIYGFATQLTMYPDDRLGVAVATTLDVANVVMDRLADYALELMLAARAGEELPTSGARRRSSPPSPPAPRAATRGPMVASP